MSNSNQVARINKHGLSRSIPEDIKREVRKRCGFGCVMCGLGIYEYEHFNPEFKNARTHDVEGITLLCPNHHNKKTKGVLSIETVKRFNDNPKALSQGFANERFDLLTVEPIIFLGGAKFISTPILLQIGNEPVLTITPGEDEPWLLSALLRGRNGEIVLSIDNNEWKTSSEQWDCRTEGSRIEVRSAPRQIELVIRQDPPDKIIIERLLMSHRGYAISANEGKITITSPNGGELSAPSGVNVINWNIGFLLEDNGTIILGCEARKGGASIGPAEPGGHLMLTCRDGRIVMGAGSGFPFKSFLFMCMYNVL